MTTMTAILGADAETVKVLTEAGSLGIYLLLTCGFFWYMTKEARRRDADQERRDLAFTETQRYQADALRDVGKSLAEGQEQIRQEQRRHDDALAALTVAILTPDRAQAAEVIRQMHRPRGEAR